MATAKNLLESLAGYLRICRILCIIVAVGSQERFRNNLKYFYQFLTNITLIKNEEENREKVRHDV